MLHMHCLHCAPLAPLNSNWHHEAIMTVGERTGWLPSALDMSLSLALLRPTACSRKKRCCDCDRGSSSSPLSPSISPNFLSKHLLWFCLTERGSCMHSHSHLSTPGPSSLLSIEFCLDPWLPSVGTCIGFVALDTAQPHILPLVEEGKRGAETKKKPCTERSSTIERYWLHSASRNGPPLLWKALS
jgi:hypothetical protein